MNRIFEKDLYRYYGTGGEGFARRLFRPAEIKYLSVMRKAQDAKSELARLFYTAKLKKMSQKTHIQIPARTKIGEGFYIGHTGRVVISPDAVIGRNVNVATGVTIGAENRGARAGAPTIGDECWIGTNAVVVGKIVVGRDVLIAPLAFVNFDVPDHSIVIGNPAKIVSKENATAGYLQNLVK